MCYVLVGKFINILSTLNSVHPINHACNYHSLNFLIGLISRKMDELITALNQSIKIVRALQKDVRFLAAEEELKALEQRIDTGLSSGALHEGSPQLDQLRAAIDKLNVKELRNRCRRIRDALAESDSKLTDDWTLGSHMFGVTTHYRHESDGNVLLRIEALQENLPFFDLVAVGFEVPLFKSWIPLCNGSDLIERLARTEFVAKIDFYTPFPFMLSREAYMHIFVAECLQEHSKVVALCRSVESNAIPGVTIPPAAPTVLHNRLDLKTMKFVFDLSSPSSARVRLKNIDNLKYHDITLKLYALK